MASIKEMRDEIWRECNKRMHNCLLCPLLNCKGDRICHFADADSIKQMYKILERYDMSFEDVPLGSVVETENGKRYMYVGKYRDFKEFTNDGYLCLSDDSSQCFESNLKTTGGTRIVKIYKHISYDYGFSNCINKSCEVIWELKEPIKEVTMADVEEKFGCKVKIVEEKEDAEEEN